MSDTYIDPDTGDLARENGSFVRVTGINEIAQRLNQALSTVQGEWFFDQAVGVPYLTTVFGKNKPTSTEVNAVFEIAILSVEGVTRLRNPIVYDLDKTNRVMSIEIDVQTSEGDLQLSFTPVTV